MGENCIHIARVAGPIPAMRTNPVNMPREINKFESLIEEVIKELKDGENRFIISKYSLHSLQGAYFSKFTDLTPSEQLLSDYGISSGNKIIENDYFDEIALLEQKLKEKNIPINLANWQTRSGIEAIKEIHKTHNRRAHAIQLWDQHAIPWRYKNNMIYVIWSPHDILGKPIIHSYSVDSFLIKFTSILEERAKNEAKISKKLNFWESFGSIAIIIFILFLLFNS